MSPPGGTVAGMRTLDPTTRLAIALSATMYRNRYTTDPDAVLKQLRAQAGDRVDVLASEAGLWAGFHEATPHVTALVDALMTIGDPVAVQVGRDRRTAGSHSTP